MNVQAFIPDWPGSKQHAEATAEIVRRHCPVTILNNPAHYFTEQWESARTQFTGDIMFWIMADVWPPDDFSIMFQKVIKLMSRHRNEIGIYAPDIDWNGHQFSLDKLTPVCYGSEVYPNMYQVPIAEMLCWFLHRDVVDAMPHVDPVVNRLGWGIDYLGVAAAASVCKVAVRDYNFTAKHPRSSTYVGEEADKQMWRWMKTLEPDMLKKVTELMMARAKAGLE